jgi:hypothetical protein
MHNQATLRVIACAGLWSALAFVLNLVWEISHVRLYTIWMETDGLRIARAVFYCSLGDVVITLATFALAGIALWRADWPVSRPWAGGAIAVIGAMAITAWSEWYNIYRTGAWSYTSDMPTIYGVGLSPLLQWLIIPPVIVVVYRALLPFLFGKSGGRHADQTHGGRIRKGIMEPALIIKAASAAARCDLGGNPRLRD